MQINKSYLHCKLGDCNERRDGDKRVCWVAVSRPCGDEGLGPWFAVVEGVDDAVPSCTQKR